MSRYKLTLEYDGGPFVGWQRQANGLGVQQAVEEAVQAFCGQAARVHCAGRTDAGVHALGQVAHVDLDGDPPADTVRDAINFHLRPNPVAVLKVEPVAPGFDARTSAIRRRYRYRIVNRRAPLALDAGRAWQVQRPLDAAAMHDAARALVGRHDFTSFRASECQAKSPLKTLDRLAVERDGEEIRIAAEARSFLHHQVRNFVGTLERVGAGRWSRADVERALAARDRAAAGPTAPACGLYFVAVDYPP
ncbi:MAG: tRNA pseudouridine(38-40) synthase TruA [Inquilinus sp.]|nr:tRNA pseudouridine(38-40) synthase TruA [Inquilinus sp.]